MSKLVDKERLAKLAQSLDQRAKAAVNAEKGRAEAEEARIEGKADANAQAIAAINNEETGLLKQAKDHADAQDASLKSDLEGKIANEKNRAEGEEAEIRSEFAAADAALKTELQAEIDADVSAEATRVDTKIAADIKVEADRAKGVEAELDGRIAANEAFVAAQPAVDQAQDAKILALENKFTGDNSVDNKIAAVQGEVDALELRVEANEGKLATINGEGEGSIKKAQADAEAYADQLIKDLIDGSKEGMDTLKELADAIEANKDVYDAYVEQHAQAMAQQKADLQAEIDADVKVVADELAKQKDAAQNGTLANKIQVNADAIATEKQTRENAMTTESARVNKKIADDIATESAARVAEEQRIEGLVTTEKGRAEGQEAAIRSEFAAADKKIVDDQKLVDQAQNDRLAALEARVGEGEGSLGEAIQAVQDALDDHEGEAEEKNNAQDQAIQAAQSAAEAAQADVDAIEGRLDNEGGLVDRLEAAEGDIDALQQFVEDHDHQPLQDAIDANKAAIEAEVGKEGVQGARDAAIAKALEDYSTTDEMKALVGNVVNSLALTMENDQVVLKLGGVDGIALTSVHLDMATDADIDAIINGLDA